MSQPQEKKTNYLALISLEPKSRTPKSSIIELLILCLRIMKMMKGKSMLAVYEPENNVDDNKVL